MERLTSDNVFEMNMTELALNQVFVRDGWAWYRRAPEDECSVCDLIRSVSANGMRQDGFELDSNMSDEWLGKIMLDWLQFGENEPEGVLAILYRALWAMAELRERLKMYEDTGLEPEEVAAIKHVLMGREIAKITAFDGIPIQRLQEIAQAEEDGRLVVLDEPRKALIWGDDAHATILCQNCNHDLMGGFPEDEYSEKDMYQCPYCGQAINSEKAMTREEAEAALKKRDDAVNETD